MNARRSIIVGEEPAGEPVMTIPEAVLNAPAVTHMTILGYLKMTGISGQHPASTLSAHGKAVVALSRRRGTTIEKVPDAKYGAVNAYDLRLLAEYFQPKEV